MESEDWLDYVPLQSEDLAEPDQTEEMLCFRKRGRGSVDNRIVPRLPLRAMIQKMKLLDDSSSSGKQSGSSRGRARLLQDRAKFSRPHGLVQKKQEKPRVPEIRKVSVTVPVDNKIESGEPCYNDQWKQADFPSLGLEHTTEGSPKKKCRRMTNDSQEYNSAGTETEQLEDDLQTQCSIISDIQQHLSDTDIVNKKIKPKVHKKEKFDFTKASQKLLQEFPIAKSGPKVLSLTQHNIEKFLRESDTESSCSSQDLMCSNVSQDNIDDLPLYERYAVTLDDIKKSKSTKSPAKVTGHLVNLLEAMDSYCENPDTYFDKFNQGTKDSYDGAVNKEDMSNKNLESIVSNVSVVSDLSNLSSPSENIDDLGNNMEPENRTVGGMEDFEGDTCKRTEDDIYNENVETPNTIENYEDVGNNLHKCNGEPILVKESGFVSDEELQLDDKFKCSDKQEVVLTQCGVDNSLCDTYVQKANDDVAGLENIDLFGKPTSPSCNNIESEDDINGFKKVVRKETKKKASPRCPKGNGLSAPADKSVWRIYAPNAIQVDGLPEICDISELQGMVAGFGAVVDYQVRTINSGTSVRFKLRSKDACEFAVQCLDETDCLFPESDCRLTCHQLHT